MNVLLLTQVLPFPPDSGPKVKTWNLLKWLGARHAVTLVSFSRGEPPQAIDTLRRYCRAVHTVPIRRGGWRDAWFALVSLFSAQPFVIVRDRRRAMRRLAVEIAREGAFDIVHVDQLNMAQYAKLPSRAAMVLDAHNALWLLVRRLADAAPPGARRRLLEREWRLLQTYEGEVGRAAAAVLAVSDADREALRTAIGTDREIAVLPIGIDPAEIAPVVRRSDADRVVHIGTMYWPPNADAIRWFAEAVWPRIRAARPHAALDVIGARPPKAVTALAGSRSGICVTGYVADPLPHLERAGVIVVPVLAGAGMRVKILTALAQGLPVVTTTIGCEGIAVQSGTHLLIADDPAAFAAATLRLLDDRTLADSLGRNGRRLIEARYDYRQIYPPLEPIYAQAAGVSRSDRMRA